MRLLIEAEKTTWQAGETVTARLVVFNDAYEAIAIDRRRLVGPSFTGVAGGGALPLAMEPGFAEETANHVVLNPFCLYGRERSLERAPSGQLQVEGLLLARPLDELGPDGLAAEGAVAARADPLTLRVE